MFKCLSNMFWTPLFTSAIVKTGATHNFPFIESINKIMYSGFE